MNVALEICVGTIGGALAARRGGADRIELCAALSEGGITPSEGLIAAALEIEGIKKNVIIRPRSGDFLYDKDEQRVMLADIRTAVRLGADGIVAGALLPDGGIDTEFLRRCLDAADGLPFTFHRAFDLCSDPRRALDLLMAAGVSRVLTSGAATTAEQGIPLLKELVRQGGTDIIIMPGCGVTEQNVARIVCETGAREVHSSASATVGSKMLFRHGGVAMGKGDADEYARRETCAERVNALKQILNEISEG